MPETMNDREMEALAVACPRCGVAAGELCTALVPQLGPRLTTSCHPQRHRTAWLEKYHAKLAELAGSRSDLEAPKESDA